MNSNLKYRIPLAIAGLLATLLSGCGGGATQSDMAAGRAKSTQLASPAGAGSESGVSPVALPADFGIPQSPAQIEAMAKILSPYFGSGGALRSEAQLNTTKGVALPKAAPYPKPVYRFLNSRTGVHFYTITESERDYILAKFPWFNLEGAGFYAQQGPVSGLSPVYRFDNLVTGTHFYTISEAEKDKVVADYPAIFRLSGPGLWASAAPAPGWVPMHRFFNRSTGTHFYTANEVERQSVVANMPAMHYDGIGYYVRTNDGPVLTGVVAVNGPVQNAVVCLDVNLNNACDTSEKQSAKTGTNGVYDISFPRGDVSEATQATSPLIAVMVPGLANNPNTTLDIDLGLGDGPQVTHAGFVMRQVPGKTGPINPLTTLVAAGVAGGMTEATARGNVAIQLAIAEAKIDNYQDDSPIHVGGLTDNARLMAGVTQGALEDGIPLEVGDQNASSAEQQGDLRSLRYTMNGYLSYLDFLLPAKAAGTPGITLLDRRLTFVAGSSVNADDYNQAYLTDAGWLRCDYFVPIQATLGVPSRSTFCNAQRAVGARSYVGVGGRPMAEVVTELQSDPLNFINTGGLPTGNLLAALGNAQFPAGSSVRKGTSLNLNQPIYINSINTDGRPQTEATTLEALIAARPAASVNLSNGGGTLSLGYGSGDFKNLRVAFTGITSAAGGSVQFYECDLDSNQQNPSSCIATSAGNYTIQTIQGARVMSFAGHAETVMSHVRHYVEVKADHQANSVIGSGDWVFLARQLKPHISSNQSENKRLNRTGWTAMKAQLGL